MPAAVDSDSAYGRELRRLRRKAGLTQVDLAKRLRVTQATVSDWEHDLLPSPKRHDQLAKVLGGVLRRFGGWVSGRTLDRLRRREGDVDHDR